MAFKIKPGYKIDNTPIYTVREKDGVVGRAGKNLTITISDKVKDPKGLQMLASVSKNHY